jgi:hypothetical protein
MSPLVSSPPVSRTPKWAFVANLAGIRLGFPEFDPRLVRGARLGLVALAGFSFAVTSSVGSRTAQAPQRGVPATPVAQRTGDFGPAVASLFGPIRTLPDLLPPQTIAPPVAAPRRRATARPVHATTRAPTSSSATPAPPAAHHVRPRIVRQRTVAAPPRPSRPAPAPQTFDSSGNTFDSSG